MGITFISKDNFPTFICLSSDIVSGSVICNGLIGETIYTTDDGKWYVIIEKSGSSLYAESYKMPAFYTKPSPPPVPD